MRDRYECLQEPPDGWLVWDLLTDCPAVAYDAILMCLGEEEARALCAALNAEHRAAGVEAPCEPLPKDD